MKREIVLTPKAPKPIGPYSQAVKAGNLVYISGQIALDAHTGQLVQGSIVDETHKVMHNMREVLAAAGSDLEHVVKCTIYVRDMNHFGTINAVYGSYFSQNPPARETVEVSRLPKDANVEISCVAVVAGDANS